MSSLAEASGLLRELVGEVPAGSKLKGIWSTTARRLGWGFNRTKDVWYGDEKRVRIEAHELDQLRALKARRDADALRSQLLALRSSLAQTDPEFHGPTIDALERALGNMGCPVESMGFRQKGRVNGGA